MAPSFAQPKSVKLFRRTEKHPETLATQAICNEDRLSVPIPELEVQNFRSDVCDRAGGSEGFDDSAN